MGRALQEECGVPPAAAREMAGELAAAEQWALPPQPCGVIAGSGGWEWFNPESLLACLLGALQGQLPLLEGRCALGMPLLHGLCMRLRQLLPMQPTLCDGLDWVCS